MLLAFLLLGTTATFQEVYFPKSVNAVDLTFAGTLNLSNDPAASELPRLATAGSNVYVVWLNNTSGNPDILFRASNNDGTSFGPVINLSNALLNGFSSSPQIAAAGSNVYVVWEDNSTGNEDVFFRASTNNGAGFGTITNLSSESRDSQFPQIAASGANVFVTWQNLVTGSCGAGCTPIDVFFRNSTNSGAGFFTVKNLSNDKVSTAPVIGAAGNNVFVAWQDTNGGKNDILLKSTTNGFTTSQLSNLSQNLLTNPVTTSFQQEMVSLGSNVYAVWTTDSSTGADDIFFTVSTNNGGIFANPVNLSNNGLSISPQVAASGTNAYVVWEDHSLGGVSKVSYRSSSNNGGIFTGTVSLSGSTGFSTNPQMSASTNSVHVVWQDSTGTDDVFFRSSSDNGASFGGTANLSNNSGFSTSPAVAAGVNAYVAWQDDSPPATPLNDDILFKAGSAKANFRLNALLSGWNSSLPAGIPTACSPTGTLQCNPTITVLNGRAFTALAIWKDSPLHVLAIYTKNFLAASVSPSNICSPSNTNGCLASSAQVSSSETTSSLVFAPSLALDDFTGPGAYEYYCQYHPGSMHGRLKVIKNPDLNSDQIVDILDIARMAVAFESTPGSPNWNIAADIDNTGRVDIIDIATAATYFGLQV